MDQAEAREIKKRSYRRNDCWFRDARDLSGQWVITATSKKNPSLVGVGRNDNFSLATAEAILDLEDKQNTYTQQHQP